ncbi:MAG: hypothetical protein ACOCY0_06275, partial [Roseicyclus sp.]
MSGTRPALPNEIRALTGARLTAGPTNALADRDAREGGERLSLDAYRAAFARLPECVRRKVEARWGPPEADPFVEPDPG